jgi:ribosomal protein S8
MRKYHLNYNYIIADFVSKLNVGLLRKLRFIKIIKSLIYIKLLIILYKYGVIRTFKIGFDHILVYFKFYRGQPFFKLSIVSRPGKRCY